MIFLGREDGARLAVREKVKELQRELERGRGDDFLESF